MLLHTEGRCSSVNKLHPWCIFGITMSKGGLQDTSPHLSLIRTPGASQSWTPVCSVTDLLPVFDLLESFLPGYRPRFWTALVSACSSTDFRLSNLAVGFIFHCGLPTSGLFPQIIQIIHAAQSCVFKLSASELWDHSASFTQQIVQCLVNRL